MKYLIGFFASIGVLGTLLLLATTASVMWTGKTATFSISPPQAPSPPPFTSIGPKLNDDVTLTGFPPGRSQDKPITAEVDREIKAVVDAKIDYLRKNLPLSESQYRQLERYLNSRDREMYRTLANSPDLGNPEALRKLEREKVRTRLDLIIGADQRDQYEALLPDLEAVGHQHAGPQLAQWYGQPN
ncbi:MAG: hypothetical protein AAGK14_14590 [Verrucomicrobiota bacterium]